MTQELATIDHDQIAVLEKVISDGDLRKLSAAEKLQYYSRVCASVGLNPLTRPFEYIELNSKLTLYARKDCTDQLRFIHNVSIRIAAREEIAGCYIVTASAILPNGRTDESTGAVSLPASGEARANALMKAETKAKRRATLSICGLGFLDESETESIPGAVRVDMDSAPMPVAAAIPPVVKAEPPSDIKYFWRTATKIGYPTQLAVYNALGLTPGRQDEIIAFMQNGADEPLNWERIETDLRAAWESQAAPADAIAVGR